MPGDVTVIIPNWNGAGRLERALDSLAAQTTPPALILVVDNGSTDGSADAAAARGAAVLSLERNYGFSRAVNEGVSASVTEWVAIVNNDVVLERQWLERLLAAAQGMQFAVPLLVNLRDPARLDGCFDLLARSGCAWRAGNGMPDAPRFRQPRQVSSPPLTAALLRRDLFQSLGPLDDRFESYMEDVEFGLRCTLAGMMGAYCPEAVARHEGSATLGAWSSAMVELISRNQVLLIAKHYPPGWFRRMGLAVLTGQLLWGALALKHGAGWAWLKGKWRGLRAWSQFRSTPSANTAETIERCLLSSEGEIRKLQQGQDAEAYWSVYFRLAR
ncbi:MAG: glycosyltransferase family 2 protein [Acidobacteria bacterium]|nr:glycosyltransferase family 2 protein [Acidobacteriota bacterium]